MKRALVTGGSGAIGAAVCQKLASNGIYVYVHANDNAAKAKTAVDKIREVGGQAAVVTFDVTDYNACQVTLGEIQQQGAIQILVNNAGIHDDAILAGMTQAQWRRVIDVSLNGFYNVTQPLLLPMMKTRWGRIVNLSSISGVMGNRGQANYAAAKAGINGATKSLASEVASRGITVNAVAPGIIESDMTRNLFDKELINKLVPMQRVGTAEEVADLIAFLASEQAAYISGQVININGAMA